MEAIDHHLDHQVDDGMLRNAASRVAAACSALWMQPSKRDPKAEKESPYMQDAVQYEHATGQRTFIKAKRGFALGG